MIVVNASILTDLLLGRPQTLDAVQRELVGREQEPLRAPELVEPETLNALRRLATGGAITDQRASEAAADLANTRLIQYPPRDRANRFKFSSARPMTGSQATWSRLGTQEQTHVIKEMNACPFASTTTSKPSTPTVNSSVPPRRWRSRWSA